MADSADYKFMELALSLAEKGRGKTKPNPMVGAVLVKNGKIIGQGYHRAVGKDHAEIAALKDAQRQAKGATLYVNLEPCCHSGRTGPCTKAIINAKISKVVLAKKDPNPLVNGKGIAQLRKSGVKVVTGILAKEAALLNDSYYAFYKNKRPFVILKLAQTIDGRIASLNGDSKWISSHRSLKMVHKLRAEVDGVVVGMGTVKADNPSLTVRYVKGENPYRIIISESLKFPPKTKLLDNNRDFKTIIATTEKAMGKFSKTKRGRNIIYWLLKKNRQSGISLTDFLEKARDFNLRSLLVEGGSKLATSFLKAGLVDKLILITAPMILGNGINTIDELNIRRLSQSIKFRNEYCFKNGKDFVFVGYPQKGGR